MSSDDNPVSKAGDDVVCEAELIQDLGQSWFSCRFKDRNDTVQNGEFERLNAEKFNQIMKISDIS